jgi:hypothetical protein
MKIYVLASDAAEFKAYVSRNRELRGAVNVTGASKIKGVSGGTLHICAGYYHNPDSEEIIREARHRGLSLYWETEGAKPKLVVVDELPTLAVGTGELDDNPDIEDTCPCPNCGEAHEVKNANARNEKGHFVAGKKIFYVHCGEKQFMVGLDGKRLKK